MTDEHEFPTTTPSAQYESLTASEKQWRNFFTYLQVVFGTAISVRDQVTSAAKLQLLLYRHPVLDIELAIKTSYVMPQSNPPWEEWKADLDVYAPRTQWETNRATRVRAYTEHYRQLTRQQRREARRKQTQECAAGEDPAVAATSGPSSSISSSSPLLPPLPALTPLASGGACDSSWCPDVVLLNHGLHDQNLSPRALSFQALLAGWSAHYPRSLFVWKTSTPQHGPKGSGTHQPNPNLHANELKYMRMVEAAAAQGTHAVVLDTYQIVSSLVTAQESSDGTFPFPMVGAPYWDPYHPWPFVHEAINTVTLRMLCQRRGDNDDDNNNNNTPPPPPPLGQEEQQDNAAAEDLTTFEERFVIQV